MGTGSTTLNLQGTYRVKKEHFLYTEDIGVIVLDFTVPTFNIDVIEHEDCITVNLNNIKDNYTGIVDVECRYKDSNNLIKNMSIKHVRGRNLFNLPIRKAKRGLFCEIFGI